MIKGEEKGKGPPSENNGTSNNGNAETAASLSVKMDVEKVGSSPNKKGTLGTSSRTKELKKGDSMGMVFMCNAKTKQDCYRYKVLGMPGSKKEMVSKIYNGMRLFLFDIDLRLLYGIYKAAGPGGYNIEPKAFNSAFPAQVRFNILEDCLPLAEEKFKVAIKDNYFGKNKFDCQLKPEQVKNLCKLFTVATTGTRSKQVIGVTDARSFVDRERDRVSHPAFSGDRLLSRENSLYERETSLVLPPQLPPPLPPAYAYDQPSGTNYPRTDTSLGDHNRWIVDMEIRRQKEIKNRDSNSVYREYPPYPDPLYGVGLQPGYSPPVDRQQPSYPPRVDIQQPNYPPPMALQQPGYHSHTELQPGYPSHTELQPGYPSHSELQPGYPSHTERQPGYPSHTERQPGYPPSAGLQPSYTSPGGLQRPSYPPTTPPPPPPLYPY